MARAEALFKKHLKNFTQMEEFKGVFLGGKELGPENFDINAMLNLYSACVIYEAIRLEQDETDFRVKPE